MSGTNAAASRVNQPPKISVIGTGMVGASLAYSFVVERVASEVVLLDVDRDRAAGEAMDINHAVPFAAATTVRAGDYEDVRASDVVVITAGVAQKPGETRLDLVSRNVDIYRDIVPKLMRVISPSTVVVIVSNPVDILTYVTIRLSGMPRGHVLGAGTILDTARLMYELGANCRVDPKSVQAYVIGEHGDSEVPVWSTANIAGLKIEECRTACSHPCSAEERRRIFDRVRTAAYEIIRLKGATWFAIALGTVRLIESILRDQKTVWTLSTLLEGQYGITDVCLSLPAVAGRGGVERVMAIPLSPEEESAFRRSADTLKAVIRKLNL